MNKDRIYFWDYLRLFAIFAVIIDHTTRAYAKMGSSQWFFIGSERNNFFDYICYIVSAFEIPLLFFISGFFIIPSLQKVGIVDFIRKKVVRLIIPFIFGVLFISPLLQYISFIFRRQQNISYVEFWLSPSLTGFMNSLYFKQLSPTGFWFIICLFIFIIMSLFLVYFFKYFKLLIPLFIRKKMNNFVSSSPYILFSFFFIMVCFLYYFSSLEYGRYWLDSASMIGLSSYISPIFSNLFLLGRGEQFFVNLVLFLSGIFLQPYLNQFLDLVHKNRVVIYSVTIISCFFYCSYSVLYTAYLENFVRQDILNLWGGYAFSDIIYITFHQYNDHIMRILSLSFFSIFVILSLCNIFYSYLNAYHKIVFPIASCSYGIYIFHEPITLYLQWYLQIYFSGFLFIKFILITILSLLIPWLLVSLLRKSYYLRKVL